jgi:hypothetical protein
VKEYTHARTADRPARAFSDRARLSVVIVNFNAGAYLAAAVESLLAQEEPPFEIIVIDNASTDDSLDTLAKVSIQTLRLHRLDRNSGFAAACNLGLREASGDLILLLNPDCRLYPGALSALCHALDGDEDAGLTGARLLNPDGSPQRGSRRDIPTPWTIFCEVLQLHRLMPRHPRFRSFNRHLEPLPEKPEVVPAVSGACMLMRREALSEAGQLDDGFFLHFEDLDLCLRFEQAGWKVLFSPDAVVEHTPGVCSARRPVRVSYAKHRSLIRFLRKHFAGYYPSSFMALVSMLVMARFVLMVPSAWLVRRRPRASAGRAR